MRKIWSYPPSLREVANTKGEYAVYTSWDVGDMSFRYGFHKKILEVPENRRPKIGYSGRIHYGEPSVSIDYDGTITTEQ